MSLRTKLGYPVGLAAALAGALRQVQRWLPRYELILPQKLPEYIAGINLVALLIGTVGAFTVGVWVDRSLDHRWSLPVAVVTALGSAVVGFGAGTALTFYVHPSFNTVTIRPLTAFLGPMAAYVLSKGVPIGTAGLAGLAVSRIHAIEAVEVANTDDEPTARSRRSTEGSSETGTDSEQLSVSDANSRFQ